MPMVRSTIPTKGASHATPKLGPSQLPTLLPSNGDTGKLLNTCQILIENHHCYLLIYNSVENAPKSKPFKKRLIHKIEGPYLL
jgi:hypothetical protein